MAGRFASFRFRKKIAGQFLVATPPLPFNNFKTPKEKRGI